MGLWRDFLTNDQRLIHKWEHYFPVYERHFARYINRPVLILEIGVFKGGSLQMWKRYFGPYARIVGIDIDPTCKAFEETQISVRIGDQSDPEFLHSVLQEFGEPDIIIDDGSHQQQHILASFRALYPFMRSDGVYLVEDLHVAYMRAFGGGHKAETSFIEVSKHLIDELNTLKERLSRQPSRFAAETMSMHFYPGIVVFEKGQHPPRRDTKTGKDAQATND